MEQVIQLKNIQPDDNQPRKYFNAEKLRTLKDSISKFGVINAITVEDMGNGNYLLVDGERRFRASTELGLTEIRANIRPTGNKTERKIEQFNIQEQHEAWTPVEKAVAISDLSEELGVTVLQTCKLLNLTSTDAQRYANFAELVDKQTWVRSEMPLDWASPMRTLTILARRLTQDQLQEQWSLSDSKKLERRIIEMVKSGVIIRRSEINRLRDAFTAQPQLIRRFLDDSKVTPVELFAESKAQGAYDLRQIMYSARYLRQNTTSFFKNPDVKLTESHIAVLKEAIDSLRSLIALKED